MVQPLHEGGSPQIDVEDTVCFMLLGFGAGLRGEEVPLVNLEGLLTFWMETRGDEDRYMTFSLWN